MTRKHLLKGISKGSKMPKNRRERFQDMCLKLHGEPRESHDTLKCRIGEDELQVKKDWSHASVNSRSQGKDHNVAGHLQNPERIQMSMIGDPDKKGEVLKTINVENGDNSIQLSSFIDT